ncbi:transcription factor bHLH47, partial [Brassica napus]|uniref:transcription factor bHLH47 n=1 Tax=Brassica napus TaxID=3708 RepID=UPI0020793EB3
KLNQRNSGKASIMCEATPFSKDVFEQIESLRKEHTSFLSVSNYMFQERIELLSGSEDETSFLNINVSDYKSEIEARVNQSKPELNISPATEYHHHHQQHPELASQCLGLPSFQGAAFQQSAATTPGTAVLVLPTQPDGQTQDTSDLGGRVQTQAPVMYNSSNVSRHFSRYASAADSCSSRLKAKE